MNLSSLCTSSIFASSALAMILPAAAQHGQHKAEPQYSVTDLGVLGAGTNSSAFDTNDRDWVAGSSNLTPGGPQHAFLLRRGDRLHDLGTLGGPNSAADGPNLFGEAPVISEISDTDPDREDFCGFGTHLQCRAAIWRNRELKALRGLPGGRNAVSIGINNLGQVVGWAETAVRDATCASVTASQVFQFQAVKWEPNGEIRVLSPLKFMGDNVAFSFGINDFGQAVGSSGICSTQGLPPLNVTGLHAVRWERDGTPTYLGTLGDASNTMFNAATSINAVGNVAGTSQFTDGTIHSFLWRKGIGMKDLGTLPGAFATIAGCCHTLNNRDEVVGFSIDGNGITAFVWKDQVIRDLNTLIPANSPLYLLNAQSMDDDGEIVGQACVLPACTEFHAYRAIPKGR